METGVEGGIEIISDGQKLDGTKKQNIVRFSKRDYARLSGGRLTHPIASDFDNFCTV